MRSSTQGCGCALRGCTSCHLTAASAIDCVAVALYSILQTVVTFKLAHRQDHLPDWDCFKSQMYSCYLKVPGSVTFSGNNLLTLLQSPEPTCKPLADWAILNPFDLILKITLRIPSSSQTTMSELPVSAWCPACSHLQCAFVWMQTYLRHPTDQSVNLQDLRGLRGRVPHPLFCTANGTSKHLSFRRRPEAFSLWPYIQCVSRACSITLIHQHMQPCTE